MIEIVGVGVRKKDNFQGKILKAVFPSLLELRVKATFNGNTKVYGFDFSKYKPPICFATDEPNALITRIKQAAIPGQESKTIKEAFCEMEWDCESPLGKIPQFPHYFCLADGETETQTDMDVDTWYFTPGDETGPELKGRLLPYLHEVAKAFVDQHNPDIANLTGNSRNVLYQIRDTESKNRMESTVNRYCLPIGFAARELDRHSRGTATLSQKDTESLIDDMLALFTKEDSWWEHHYGHDVKYWNKYHNARHVLLDDAEGNVRSIYDIDANIRKNLPKIDRDNKKLIEKQGEVEFHSLATEWFSKALYGPREHITHRKLTFEEKT